MKRKPHSRRKRTTTKSVLRLPDLEHAKAAVLNSLTSLDAQRGYRHAIDEFVDWYCSEPRLALNRIVVLRYRSHLESRQLAPGTVNLRLGAVRRLAYEAADCGLLSADLAAARSLFAGASTHSTRQPLLFDEVTRSAAHNGGAVPGAICCTEGLFCWRLALRSWPACRCLPHADFRAATFKRNLIHHRLHHPDATPVVGADVLANRGIGHRIRVKSLSLVFDDDANPLSQFTAAKNLNQLLAVHTVAMNDCIV